MTTHTHGPDCIAVTLPDVYDGTAAWSCPDGWRHRFPVGDPRRAHVDAWIEQLRHAAKTVITEEHP